MQNYNNPDTNVFHWRKRIRRSRGKNYNQNMPVLAFILMYLCQ